MRLDAKKSKKAMTGFKQMAGSELANQSLHLIMNQGKRALVDLSPEKGRVTIT